MEPTVTTIALPHRNLALLALIGLILTSGCFTNGLWKPYGFRTDEPREDQEKADEARREVKEEHSGKQIPRSDRIGGGSTALDVTFRILLTPVTLAL